MMSPAREMFSDALQRAEDLKAFQAALGSMTSKAEQKRAVIDAVCHGLISHADTELLFEIYQLAEA